MTDTNEHNTNTITRQVPEELSEQDMQAVNGGMPKVGNPQAMLEDVLRHPSPSSSSSSLGIGQMQEGYPTPAAPAPDARSSVMQWVKRPATRGAAGSIVVGGVTAFGVGAVTG